MKLISIDNLRLTDRNKAGGKAVFEKDGKQCGADLVFYLQGDSCLSIRVGRHDLSLATKEIDEYLFSNRITLKKDIKPDVERLRQEARGKG